MPTQLSLAVVGAAYPNADGSNRMSEILMCAPGDPIELRPEPTNEKDPYAIAVYNGRGNQLGYLSAERAPWIGSKMADNDVRAVFQHAISGGAWIRVSLVGEEPVLPPAPTAAPVAVTPIAAVAIDDYEFDQRDPAERFGWSDYA